MRYYDVGGKIAEVQDWAEKAFLLKYPGAKNISTQKQIFTVDGKKAEVELWATQDFLSQYPNAQLDTSQLPSQQAQKRIDPRTIAPGLNTTATAESTAPSKDIRDRDMANAEYKKNAPIYREFEQKRAKLKELEDAIDFRYKQGQTNTPQYRQAMTERNDLMKELQPATYTEDKNKQRVLKEILSEAAPEETAQRINSKRAEIQSLMDKGSWTNQDADRYKDLQKDVWFLEDTMLPLYQTGLTKKQRDFVEYGKEIADNSVVGSYVTAVGLGAIDLTMGMLAPADFESTLAVGPKAMMQGMAEADPGTFSNMVRSLFYSLPMTVSLATGAVVGGALVSAASAANKAVAGSKILSFALQAGALEASQMAMTKDIWYGYAADGLDTREAWAGAISGGAQAAIEYITLGSQMKAMKGKYLKFGKDAVKKDVATALRKAFMPSLKEFAKSSFKVGLEEGLEEGAQYITDLLVRNALNGDPLPSIQEMGMQLVINVAGGMFGGVIMGGVGGGVNFMVNANLKNRIAKMGKTSPGAMLLNQAMDAVRAGDIETAKTKYISAVIDHLTEQDYKNTDIAKAESLIADAINNYEVMIAEATGEGPIYEMIEEAKREAGVVDEAAQVLEDSEGVVEPIAEEAVVDAEDAAEGTKSTFEETGLDSQEYAMQQAEAAKRDEIAKAEQDMTERMELADTEDEMRLIQNQGIDVIKQIEESPEPLTFEEALAKQQAELMGEEYIPPAKETPVSPVKETPKATPAPVIEESLTTETETDEDKATTDTEEKPPDDLTSEDGQKWISLEQIRVGWDKIKSGEEPPVARDRDGKIRAVVTKSTKSPGKWQLTFFNGKEEPAGDSEYDSYAKALKELRAYLPMRNDIDPSVGVHGRSDKSEYYYDMRSRPPDVGTYPTNGNTRIEYPEGVKWGRLVYDRMLSDDEIYRYELIPRGYTNVGGAVIIDQKIIKKATPTPSTETAAEPEKDADAKIEPDTPAAETIDTKKARLAKLEAEQKKLEARVEERARKNLDPTEYQENRLDELESEIEELNDEIEEMTAESEEETTPTEPEAAEPEKDADAKIADIVERHKQAEREYRDDKITPQEHENRIRALRKEAKALGAKLVGYKWMSKLDEDFDRMEGSVVKRVSDWDNSADAEVTGKNIVHLYAIEVDGVTKTYGIGTAAKILGVTEADVRAYGKNIRAKRIEEKQAEKRRADKERLDAAKARAEKKEPLTVDEYRLTYPDGYVQDGERYVYRPKAPDVVAEESLAGKRDKSELPHQAIAPETDGKRIAQAFVSVIPKKLIARIDTAKNGTLVTLKNGKQILINTQDGAIYEGNKRYAGRIEFVKIGDTVAVVDIAKNWNNGNDTAYHEGFHLAFNMFLTQEERNILTEKYGNEEEAAKAFAKYAIERNPRGVLQAIADVFRKLAMRIGDLMKVMTGKDFKQTAQDLMERIRFGQYAPLSADERGLINGKMFKVMGYHGSGAFFDRFDLRFVGTGEGAQAFGWGIYVTEKEDIARYYAEAIAGYRSSTIFTYKGEDYDRYAFANLVEGDSKYIKDKGSYLTNQQINTAFLVGRNNKEILESLNSNIETWENAIPPSWMSEAEKKQYKQEADNRAHNLALAASIISEGTSSRNGEGNRNLYAVSVWENHTEDVLDWNEAPTQGQYEKINKQAKAEGLDYSIPIDVYLQEDVLGEGVYEEISNVIGSDKAASEFLLRAGIDGIRFSSEKRTNYVVFDADQISITDHARYKLAPDASSIAEAERQMEEVRAKYEGADQWLKAPNGKKSNLNERQWLQVRTQNFKDWFGDWENDPANASKVVDENGEPLVLFHGTEARTLFTDIKTPAFFSVNPDEASAYSFSMDYSDRQRASSKRSPAQGADKYSGKRVPYTGIFADIPNTQRNAVWATDEGVGYVYQNGKIDIFTDLVMSSTGYVQDKSGNSTVMVEKGKSTAYDAWKKGISEWSDGLNSDPEGAGRVYPVFLNIRNPKFSNALEANTIGKRLGKEEAGAALVQKTQQAGHDGIATTSDDPGAMFETETRQFVAFSPTQIKSATANVGTFSNEDADIRYKEIGRDNSISPLKIDRRYLDVFGNDWTDLSKYTDYMYREIGLLEAAYLINPRAAYDPDQYTWYSNNPDLATAQGDYRNKGIVVKLSTEGLQGKISTTKPSFEYMFNNGDVELEAAFNRGTQYKKNIVSVTIKKGALTPPRYDKSDRIIVLQAIKNWEKVENDDGSVTFFNDNSVSYTNDTRYKEIEDTATQELPKVKIDNKPNKTNTRRMIEALNTHKAAEEIITAVRQADPQDKKRMREIKKALLAIARAYMGQATGLKDYNNLKTAQDIIGYANYVQAKVNKKAQRAVTVAIGKILKDTSYSKDSLKGAKIAGKPAAQMQFIKDIIKLAPADAKTYFESIEKAKYEYEQEMDTPAEMTAEEQIEMREKLEDFDDKLSLIGMFASLQQRSAPELAVALANLITLQKEGRTLAKKRWEAKQAEATRVMTQFYAIIDYYGMKSQRLKDAEARQRGMIGRTVQSGKDLVADIKAAHSLMESLFEELDVIGYGNAESIKADLDAAIQELDQMDETEFENETEEAKYAAEKLALSNKIKAIQQVYDMAKDYQGDFKGWFQQTFFDPIVKAAGDEYLSERVKMQMMDAARKQIYTNVFGRKPRGKSYITFMVEKSSAKVTLPRRAKDGSVIPTKYSLDEIAGIYAHSLNDDADTMIATGFDAEFMEALNDYLDNTKMGQYAKQWADWVVNVLSPALYDDYSRAFEARYGIPLGKEVFYIPIKRFYEHVPDTNDMFANSHKNTESSSMWLTYFIDRVGSTRELDHNHLSLDAKMNDYIHSMEHFKAYAPVMEFARRTIMRRDAKIALKRLAGPEFVRTLNNYYNDLARNSRVVKYRTRVLEKINNNFFYAAMIFSIMSGFKQISSTMLYANYIEGNNKLLKYVPALINTLFNFRTVAKKIRQAPLIAKRMEHGYNIEMFNAIHSHDIGKLTHLFIGATNKYAPTRIGDMLAVFGGGAMYLSNKAYYQKQGMSEAEAEAKAMMDIEKATIRSQQSSEIFAVSEMQAGISRGSMGGMKRLMSAFQSQPIAILNSMANAMRSAKTPKAKIQIAQQAMNTLVFYPLVFSMVASAFVPKDSWDDWVFGWIHAVLGNIGVFGNFLQYAATTIRTGKVNSRGAGLMPVIESVEKLAYSGVNMFAADDKEDFGKALANFSSEFSQVSGVPVRSVRNLYQGLAAFVTEEDVRFARLLGVSEAGLNYQERLNDPEK